MKKKNMDKQKILGSFTFIALTLLLVIQVSYILKSARLEEQNFNHRVIMGLRGAKADVAKRIPSCVKFENYLCGERCSRMEAKRKAYELDSIIKVNLQNYHIDLEYKFQVTDSIVKREKGSLWGPSCYLQNLNGLLEKDGFQLRVDFPDRNQFLMAQLSGLFLLSILFAIFVMFSFVFTQKLFRKEKLQMERTQDFINNMVHEFQTPLANIRFASSLIGKRELMQNDHKVTDYLGIINHENEKMEEHVDKILKLACVEKNQCEVEELKLNDLLRKLGGDFTPRVKAGEGVLNLRLDACEDLIRGEWSQVVVVFSNLIDNALKYSGGAPDVELISFNETNKIVVEVRDKGIGIKPHEQGRIFEKYYRVSTGDVHNVKGFGLGLTYVKNVVDALGGTIAVNSKVNQGACFIVKIPLLKYEG